MTLATLPPKIATPNDERKLSRWAQHRFLREHSIREGGRKCMNALGHGTRPSIAVGPSGESHKGGVMRCSSLSCPVCGPVIRARRNTEIDLLLSRALNEGALVYFLTVTLQHKLGDQLKDIWAMMQGAYSKAWGGRGPKAAGYLGQVRVIETTYGGNGFHPHIHAAIVFAPGTPEWRAEGLLTAAGVTYRQGVAAAGGHVTKGRAGWHVEACRSVSSVVSYLVKIEGRAKGDAGLAMELTRGDLKRASVALGRGLSQFELLELATAGDTNCARLFSVYERAAYRRQLISIGAGLRERYGVEVVTDEEAAVEAIQAEPVAVYVFTPKRWNGLARAGRIGQVEVMLFWHHQHGYLLPDWLRRCRVA